MSFFFEALSKHAAAGPVSDEEAHDALKRYKRIEKTKPTGGQLARYAGLGAVGGVAINAAKDAIQGGGKVLGGSGPLKSKLRHAAGSAIAGAATSGALPLVRNHLDQQAEKGVLKKYLKQQPALEKDSAMSGHTPAKPWSARESADWYKIGGAITPAGRLAQSRKVGLPKMSAPPGASIADTVPTFGSRMPGANKTTIGKRTMPAIPTLG